VSDRPGGKGGLDIWYTSYNAKKQEWAEPKNGGIMNTTETECTPFFHIPTQTFYFSSDGHGSAGGLDVYKTFKDNEGRYVKPQNLSFPINSPQDDLHFMLDKSGKNGVVVSNRPGGTPFFHETCCDDIYTFRINDAKPFNCTLEIAISDPDSTPNKSRLLNITLVDLKTKQEKKDTVRINDNKYVFPLAKNHQYIFKIDQEGYQKDSLVVETREMASSDIIKRELSLRPVEVEIIAEKPVEDKPFVLKDITYNTGEYNLNEEAKAALDSVLIPFLKLHPKDRIIIGSHTDDLGPHKYNLTLSQKRADNVVKYLVSKGIDKSRITAIGYGETKPIAPNQNEDGTDNAIGRAINRRTEFLLEKAK
jgi:OOP family OmpA-OmpF porin